MLGAYSVCCVGYQGRLMVAFGGIVAACRLVLGDRASPRPMVVYTYWGSWGEFGVADQNSDNWHL